ncbi:MAG: ATP-binding cassette domain-containing protein [Lachnospiraceae bacterium]|nr:ATP-binding cassette domain-containing protein [Lachnospiraceae bacterium]
MSKAINNKNRIRGMIAYMLSHITKLDLIHFFTAATAVTLIGLFIPRLSYNIFSSLVDTPGHPQIYAMILFFFVISLFQTVLNTFKSYIVWQMQLKSGYYSHKAFMEKLLDLPVNFFRQYSSGNLADRIASIQNISNSIIELIFSGTFTAALSIIYFIQMIKFAPKLAFDAAIILFIQLSLTFVTALVQISVSTKLTALRAQENGTSFSIISGIRKIRLAGAERRAYSLWENIYKKCLELSYNPPIIIKISGALNTTVALVGQFILYRTAINNHIDLVHYIAFTSAYALTSAACSNLTSVTISSTAILPAIELVRPIVHARAETSDERQHVDSLDGSITLRNVSFRYTSDTPMVIDNLSIDVHPGDYLAIVGESGSGKSTLIRLMLGFETPERGEILYNNTNINDLNLRDIRKNIGSVLQNGKLLPGSIRSNISLTNKDLTDRELWKAAEIAGIADDIKSMPLGMNTVISENSGTISGGQRQRILIARAIASKPNILIFDEATSALDNITQKKISNALDRLGCTRIIVAHRLSTIKQCHRIVFIHDGKIVEDGTYKELMSQGRYFYKLVMRQQIDM